MMSSLSESKEGDLFGSPEVISLYSGKHQFHLVVKGNDEGQREMIVNVSIKSSPGMRKTLHIQVTDDKNALTLLSLVITCADYEKMKGDQGLLVDFEKFPEQLKDLFVRAQTEPNRYHLVLEQLTGEPFSGEKCLVKFVESNPFKLLTHLALPLNVSSDFEIKQYLAVLLKKTKETVSSYELQVSKLELEKLALAERVQGLSVELKKLRDTCEEEKKNNKLQFETELNAEKEVLWKLQDKLLKSYENDKVKFQQELETEKSQLLQTTEGLQLENKALLEQNREAESKLRNLMDKLETLERDNNMLLHDKSTLLSQNFKLDTDYHEKDTQWKQLKAKTVLLEQDLQTAYRKISDLKEKLHVTTEDKVKFETILNLRETSLTQKEEEVATLFQELTKAHEIINNYNEELRTGRQKVAVALECSKAQENLISQKDSEIVALKAQVQEFTTQSQELESLRLRLAEAENTVKVKDETIAKNASTISWLNRKLNDLQMKVVAPKSTGLEETCHGYGSQAEELAFEAGVRNVPTWRLGGRGSHGLGTRGLGRRGQGSYGLGGSELVCPFRPRSLSTSATAMGVGDGSIRGLRGHESESAEDSRKKQEEPQKFTPSAYFQGNIPK